MLVNNGLACVSTTVRIHQYFYPTMRQRTRLRPAKWIVAGRMVEVPEQPTLERYDRMLELWEQHGR